MLTGLVKRPYYSPAEKEEFACCSHALSGRCQQGARRCHALESYQGYPPIVNVGENLLISLLVLKSLTAHCKMHAHVTLIHTIMRYACITFCITAVSQAVSAVYALTVWVPSIESSSSCCFSSASAASVIGACTPVSAEHTVPSQAWFFKPYLHLKPVALTI